MGALAALVALVVAAIAPTIVSAAQLSTRSVALSSSSKGATGVKYTVKFTPTQDAAAYDIFFCKESPVAGDTCTAPTGFDASGVSGSGITASTNKIEVTGDLTADTPVSAEFDGIKNPTTTDPLYARIVTYTTANVAAAGTATATSLGAFADEGGVAIGITDTTEVSAIVQESMTFCVAGNDLSQTGHANCDNTTGALPPTLKLGDQVGSDTILSTALSTGTIYTQLSTNAASGAVVSLQSSTKGCGGLVRAGADTNAHGCGIAPALTSGVDTSTGTFGVKLGTASATTGAESPIGTLQAAGTSDSSAYYNSTGYKLNYVLGDGTGVTSNYGDPIIDTNNAPVNNENMPLIFAASAGPNTPAGTYSADLSLVATAKF